MDPGERKGWMEIITVDDLDNHMAAIGQAEANAGIVNKCLPNIHYNQIQGY